MADGSGGGDGDGPAPQADAATPTAIMASTRLRPAPRPGMDGPRSGSVTGRLLGGMRAGGRGAAWTDERGTSEETRRCLRGAPEASRQHCHPRLPVPQPGLERNGLVGHVLALLAAA